MIDNAGELIRSAVRTQPDPEANLHPRLPPCGRALP